MLGAGHTPRAADNRSVSSIKVRHPALKAHKVDTDISNVKNYPELLNST